MKSSLLGALGSFVTVVLMYHILQLSARETYVRYLDSTEITNYTLLESLLSGTHRPEKESVQSCLFIAIIIISAIKPSQCD